MKKIYLIIPALLSYYLQHFFRSLPSALWCLYGRFAIYANARRPTTIEKSSKLIIELAIQRRWTVSNQLARWVSTKESHASKIQKIIAEYFLTQRIKSSASNYEALLKGAHSVMVAAMKCKQSTEASAAKNLKESILAFQKTYESK